LIGNAQDLNTFITPGFWVQNLDTQAVDGKNYPVGHGGTLVVYASGAGQVTQIYYAWIGGDNNGVTFTRTTNYNEANTFQPWTQFATLNQLTDGTQVLNLASLTTNGITAKQDLTFGTQLANNQNTTNSPVVVFGNNATGSEVFIFNNYGNNCYFQMMGGYSYQSSSWLGRSLVFTDSNRDSAGGAIYYTPSTTGVLSELATQKDLSTFANRLSNDEQAISTNSSNITGLQGKINQINNVTIPGLQSQITALQTYITSIQNGTANINVASVVSQSDIQSIAGNIYTKGGTANATNIMWGGPSESGISSGADVTAFASSLGGSKNMRRLRWLQRRKNKTFFGKIRKWLSIKPAK
jgi:hypothetical protein